MIRNPVGDQASPFFRLRFVDVAKAGDGVVVGPDGTETRTPLEIERSAEFLQVGESRTFSVRENEAETELRAYATAVTITQEGGAATFLTAQFELPLPDAIRLVDSRVVQWNSLVLVEWGYLSPDQAGSTENSYSRAGLFQIMRPDLSISEAGASVSVTGVDPFTLSLIKRESRRTWDRKSYPTDADILAALVDRNNYTLDTSQVPRGEAGALHSLFTERPLEGEPESLDQNEGDWAFFMDILRSNNCSFYVAGTTVFVVDKSAVKSSRASYRLLLGAQPETDRDVLIVSFSTTALSSLFMAPEAKEVWAIATDPDKNEPQEIRFDPAKAPDNPALGGPRVPSGTAEADGRALTVSGDTVVPNPRYEDDQTGRTIYLPHGTPNREEVAKQPARDKALLAGVEAEVTVVGVPTIEPMQIVEIAGVGEVLSGFYLVTKVEHSFSGGYTSQLTLVRDASSSSAVAGKGAQPVAQASPEAPDTVGGETVTVTPAERA